jgi:hypothetical protein
VGFGNTKGLSIAWGKIAAASEIDSKSGEIDSAFPSKA